VLWLYFSSSKIQTEKQSSVMATHTMLVELGFDEPLAKAAHIKFGGDVDRAAEWLFGATDGDKAALLSPPSPPPPLQGHQDRAAAAHHAPAAASGPLKMILVVRTDVGMSTGKMCAQCGHASVNLVLAIQGDGRNGTGAWLQRWLGEGCAKIALQTDGGESELRRLRTLAQNAGLPTSIVQDAGRTQVEAGTATVLGIGPAPASLIDSITGTLKLL
jgi:PTH2 family peptidyl-tRNA hydrolase